MPTTYLHQKPGQRLAFVPDAAPELIAETLVALANSEGGALVLGANADGRLGTIFTSDEAADAVMAAERLCRPPVRTQWQQ
ncbi:MAG: putative DNA binding domain-containing protein, partial [Caldilineaceae bacterium]|nr:putative DNA binding domain-containing protein [Caldilineaceae bacterium]